MTILEDIIGGVVTQVSQRIVGVLAIWQASITLAWGHSHGVSARAGGPLLQQPQKM